MTLGQSGPRNNRLDARRMYQLVKLVEQRYTASNMNDAEFARAVAPELGFSVTDGNVFTAREIAGLANNKPNVAAATWAELRTRVQGVEGDLTALQGEVARIEAILTRAVARLDALIELANPVVPRLKEHLDQRVNGRPQ